MSTTTEIECRCCKQPARGKYAHVAICQVCAICDKMHGVKLYQRVLGHLNTGSIAWGHALAVLALDDAWITGNARIIAGGGFKIYRVPKRWEVVIAQYRILGTPIEQPVVAGAVIAPFMGKQLTPEVRSDIEREMRSAMSIAVPNVVDFDIAIGMSEAGEVRVELTAKVAANPQIMIEDKSAEIPADILARPRGQA